MTQWKTIEGFLYEVSDDGHVRNRHGKLIKGRPNQDGHLRVCLRHAGTGKDFLVSRLVATCFIPNPDQLPHVRHKDFDRSNNAADNLEWCNNRDNITKAVNAGRFDALVSPSRAKRLTPETAQKVYDMRLEGKSYAAIGLAFDITPDNAMKVCQGIAWSHESRPPLPRKEQLKDQ